MGSAKQSVSSTIVFGGTPGGATTESWNGSSWTEVNDLANSRSQLGGAGSSAVSAIAFGGGTDTYTEEWTADNALADVTVSQT